MGFNPNSKRHIFYTGAYIFFAGGRGKRINAKGTLPQQGFLANDDNDGVFRSQRTGSKSMGVNICGARSRSQQTVGDLAGPLAFAAFMGTSRLLYGKFGDKLNLNKCMFFSACLCVISYLCIALIPVPAIGLIGCALCGFSVGVLWPGTFSKSSAAIKRGGTVMFAMLALAGDLGCSGGPTLAGLVSGNFNNNLHIGILSAIIFPAIMLLCLLISKYKLSKS